MMTSHEHAEGCCGKHGHGHGHRHGAVLAGPGDQVVLCAVRGNQTLRSVAEEAGLYRDHGPQRYHFCCQRCADLFDADPAAYQGDAAPPSE